MKCVTPLPRRLLLAALLLASWPVSVSARGYSSGGRHSYSSHSSSFGGGASHSFSFGSSSGSSSHSSSSGSSGSIFSSGHHSYSSGSSSSDESSRHSYSSGKSYSSGFGSLFSSGSSGSSSSRPHSSGSGSGSSSFSFDTAAAHARSEQASRDGYTHYRESQNSAPPPRDSTPPPTYTPRTTTIRVYHQNVYIPDAVVLSTRPARIRTFFQPYYLRPIVRYNDPYSSLFWWWLLDRSLDDRALWAYNHRYDMDAARYQALLDQDAQLQARVQQLEAQQTPVDPNYVPSGLDPDLMYSDEHLQHVYDTRPTASGQIAFWLFGVPLACGVCFVFIWLMFFKRWNVSPQPAT